MIGNKCDLTARKAVSFEVAKEFADSMDIEFLETSAKSAQNVEKAFITMAEKVKEKYFYKIFCSFKVKEEQNKLTIDSKTPDKKGCC